MSCEFCDKNKIKRKIKCKCKFEHHTCIECRLAFLNNYLESFENEFNVDCTEQLSKDTIRYYDKMIKELTKVTNNLEKDLKRPRKSEWYKYCMECLEGLYLPRDLQFSFDMVVSVEQQIKYNYLHLK
jgi:hypothetical protein